MSQLTRSALYVSGLVFTCFRNLGPPSASWGLCALVSAPWTRCLGLGACVHLFRLTACTLCRGGCSSSCAGRVVCAAQVCMPSHYGNPSPALCAGCVCLLGTWACPVYYFLARFICPITLATWDCPLCCKGCVCWLGLYATPLSVPKPAVCLGSQSMSC